MRWTRSWLAGHRSAGAVGSGGVRDSSADGQSRTAGHEARAHRDLLLPALHGIQSRIGYISQPALAYVCRRLSVPPAEAYGVATFYALFATTPRPPLVAHVCDDIACRLAGAEELCADARAEARTGRAAGTSDGRATWLRSPCLGQCERAPAALFTIAGETPSGLRRRPDRCGRGRRAARRSGTRRAAGAAAAGDAGAARRSSAVGPAGGRRRPPAPGPDRPGRPDQPRRLSGARRLRGPCRGTRPRTGPASSPR